MSHRSPPKVAMNSSGPVFTKQNPFPPAPKVRTAHYHPSSNQPLSKKEKKTTLSPVRLNQRSRTKLHNLNRESQQLSKKHDRFSSIDGQPVLKESQASTVFEFSPDRNTASSDMDEPKQSGKMGNSSVSQVQGGQEDSVLAKYVERFRHGRPQSREERHQVASASGEEQAPFWWMSHSSLSSSTPTKTTDEDVIQLLKEDQDPALYDPSARRDHNRSPSPYRGSNSLLHDMSQGEFDDREILHLQEKASRLLLRGECSVSDGSVPVSSEGLGCSDFSSPISIDEPVKQPLIPSLFKNTTEEDILFQWRLRRKMEQARERPLSVQASSPRAFGWQATRLSYPSISEQAYKEQQGTQPPQFSQRDTHSHITAAQPETTEAQRFCPPAPDPSLFPTINVSGSVPQPQSIAHVPSHMHFLCDVLPCPIQSSHAKVHQSISQRLDESQTKVVHKKTQVPESLGELTLCERMSLTLPAPSEREWPDHQKMSEKNKKKKTGMKQSEVNGKEEAALARQQKKSARNSLHQKLPKNVTSCKEQQQPERRQELPSESCAGDHEPPPSAIRNALGQVVSEVLFPTVDSSSPKRIPVSSDSPSCTVSAPSPPPIPPSTALNSMEVISQLLQEAEDSDEKEFGDDPLLQVLRKQRKWVKEQISEVDSILNEFVEEQQVT
ncbi:proline and serine-rich protein 3 isoform X2 [Pelmatolapia mariae]|uniref:proline and serine-rich protein 3 isoform X2 n=1 Tax=Pelmatolapia mariae TaxID=158779 RepID=UPI002FE53C38